MKTVVLFVVTVAAMCAGCTANGSSTNSGTITVEVTGADAAFSGGATAEIHVFPAGGVDYNDPANVVAAEIVPMVSNTLNTTLKVDNGSFGPTTEEWIGEPGWGQYEIFLLFDFDGDHYITPGIGEKTNRYPAPLMIDGNMTLSFDYETELTER